MEITSKDFPWVLLLNIQAMILLDQTSMYIKITCESHFGCKNGQSSSDLQDMQPLQKAQPKSILLEFQSQKKKLNVFTKTVRSLLEING